MNYDRIKELAKTKRITLKDIALKIKMSRAGMYRTFRDDTLKVETLEKIADVLGVPVTTFFDEQYQAQPQPKRTGLLQVDLAHREQYVEFMCMALNSVNFNVNYVQTDLINRTLNVLQLKHGNFTVTDSARILHQWQTDWDTYFNSQ